MSAVTKTKGKSNLCFAEYDLNLALHYDRNLNFLAKKYETFFLLSKSEIWFNTPIKLIAIFKMATFCVWVNIFCIRILFLLLEVFGQNLEIPVVVIGRMFWKAKECDPNTYLFCHFVIVLCCEICEEWCSTVNFSFHGFDCLRLNAILDFKLGTDLKIVQFFWCR